MSRKPFIIPVKKEPIDGLTSPGTPMVWLPVYPEDSPVSSVAKTKVENKGSSSKKKCRTPNPVSKAASKKAVPGPKRSQVPPKPEKPDSAFLTFIKRHSKAYATDGCDDGVDRAGVMWPKVSQALRNKYEREYLKQC